MNKLLCSVLLLLLGVETTWCQSEPADWRLVQAISTGASVRVQTASRKHDGIFNSASNSSIQLTSREGAQVTVPRNDITRVYTRSKSQRTRNALIGTAIGAGLGIAMYATVGQMLRNEGGENTGLIIAVPIAIGGGLAAIAPTGRLNKIYDVSRK